jgi:hypothetical protein
MADKPKEDRPKTKKTTHVCEHEHWTHEPESHDFSAAEEYLTLLMPDPDAKAYRKKLYEQRYQIVHRKAKDIFRASGLSLLPIDNYHVNRNIEKLDCGEELSPLLLVRGNYQRHLIIADGYHRLCAAYWVAEDMEIPCVLL